MSVSVSGAALENYDQLLLAVKETHRGRAFLDEFSARARRDETQTVLNAIQKIENVISDAGIASNYSPVLNEARHSISTIRKEIAGLADTSQQKDVPLSARIAAALKLVDDLEQRMQVPSRGSPPALITSVSAESDIFVSAAPVKTAAVIFEKPPLKPSIVPAAGAPTEVEKEVKRGATLTISRNKSSSDTAVVTSPVETAVAPIATVEVVTPKALDVASVEEKPVALPTLEIAAPAPVAVTSGTEPAKRIVIIRRPASESVEIPFLADEKSVNAA